MKYNFIIPYRNRKEHLNDFIRCFSKQFNDTNIDAKFYIIEQLTPGKFNRGALLNIGFLEVCKSRPDGLFIFHDVDIYPKNKNSIDYHTQIGQIRHPVGQKNTNLGTICCFYKNEFEKINGFPNYWGWGIEDVTIMYRAKKENIIIDENNIIDINDKTKCHNPGHYRGPENYDCAKVNTELYNKEVLTGVNDNGISNIKYNVIAQFELQPNFTMIDVDFSLSES